MIHGNIVKVQCKGEKIVVIDREYRVNECILAMYIVEW